MTTMIAELYDALVAAGSPDDKARKAAEAMAAFDAYQQRFERVETDLAELKRDVSELKRDVASLDRRLSAVAGAILVLRWMTGFVLAFLVAITVKLFLQ